MSTGQLHASIDDAGEHNKCRCTLGEDHYESGQPVNDEGDAADESLSVGDAADIWRSKGMDEDYMFGYSDDELRNA